MLILSHNLKRSRLWSFALRSIVVAVIISLIFCQPISYAQPALVLDLPQPGTMVDLSPAYVPVIVKGLRVHPENPILFDFIMDTGNSGLDAGSVQLRSESDKLIKYFLASLTIPEDDLWVNLSPYEKNRIIPEQLGQTVMGRDMLAQDYILKQLTASLIYPEKNLGKEFWNRVYTRAQGLLGSSQVPVNTFNKVWIVADKAKVYVHDNTAFVVACHMKVMLEEDYLALQKHNSPTLTLPTKGEGTNSLGSQIVREIILPELEKEVNQGKNFANLRQIFNSMILAAWYKKNLKAALLNQVYSNRTKINGIDVSDKTIKEQIYQEYLKAYKKGVFNYIKEDSVNGQLMPRKYFSGGEVFNFRDLAQTSSLDDIDAANFIRAGPAGRFVSERVITPDAGGLFKPDSAMNARYRWDDPDKVRRLIENKLKRAFRKPIELNPTTSDNNFLRTHPGIPSWPEMARLAIDASHENGQDRPATNILQALINYSNAMPWLSDNRFGNLQSAKERDTTEFISPGSTEEAFHSYEKGEFFVEWLAGGAADRARNDLINLGLDLPDSLYRIWNIKFWDIIRAAKEGNLQPKRGTEHILRSVQDISIPEHAKDYTIGQRLLYAMSKGIDDIPRLTDEEKIGIRKNLKIVIHVNDDILNDVVSDLKKFNFFGFTPGNIVLVNGGYGPGFRITDHGLEEVKETKITWNHEFAFMENKWKTDGVYTFNEKLELVETNDTVNNFLYKHNARYGLVRRVNDAILLHPEGAMDWQFFSAFLGARQRTGANVLYQVMPNTAQNKGGLALTMPGMGEFSFPLEGLDSQEFDILQKLTGMAQSPYNRLYMIYDLKSVDTATNNRAISLSLKIRAMPMNGRNGRNVLLVSPESPIGNILLVPGVRGLAVERPVDLLFNKGILTPQDYEGKYAPGEEGNIPGERIHDIKTLRDFVEILAPIYDVMDRGLNLEAFAARFRNNNGSHGADQAMVAPGGIDLNSKNLQMDVSGQAIDLKFDPAMIEEFKRSDFSGLYPVIINIRPISNIASMLGLNSINQGGDNV